ncbi:MAG: serine hydrolase domain-containing protein [Acidobacteriota bacterium]
MRRWVTAVLIMCAGLPLLAQSRAGSAPGVDPATIKKVDAIFARYTAEGSPGCSVSVARAGKLLFAKGYGTADLEHHVPITPDTLFYVASVSKQFTGISIGLLIQRGVISPDDDVRKYVPEMPDFGTKVTIAHLLHHTSGVRDFLGLQGLAGFPEDEPLTERGFLAMMSRQKALNFAPGDEHLYSNSGYALLAIIVKRASGSSLKDFAAKDVLGPLGMKTSRFRDDHTEPIPDRAIGYAPRDGGYRQSVPTFDVVGDGGLFSSARELAMWDPTDLPATIGRPGLTAMLTAPARLNNGTSVPYAMGLRLDTYRGLPIVRHGGAYGGYQTDVTRFPGERMGVTVLCNLSNAPAWQWGSGGLAQQVADVFFADRFTGPVPTPPAPPAGQTGSALGTIVRGPVETASLFSEELDARWTISVQGAQLQLTRRNQPVEVLSGSGEANAPYVRGTMTIRLARGADGKITGMSVDADRVKGLKFVRVGG